MAICEFCNKKKVNVIPFTCKCGFNRLCTICRYPEIHNCTYDHKTEGKKILAIKNPIITSTEKFLNKI
jgi:hypothetical protein